MRILRSYPVCIGRRQGNIGHSIRNEATENRFPCLSPNCFFVEYFDYGEIQVSDTVFDVEEFLQRSQKREQEQIERKLDRVDKLLEERERIHEDAVTELESKLDWYIERLEDLYRTGVGQGKDELKQRIEQFYAELRELERKQWLDTRELELQREEIEKELQDADLDDVLDLLSEL